MIHHDPSEVHSMVHVLLGETGFEWDAIRRDLDNSGDLSQLEEQVAELWRELADRA